MGTNIYDTPLIVIDVLLIVAETVPGFNMVGWQGFLVPVGTPGEIIQRLHREIVAVFALPDVRQRMFDLG